MHSSIDKLNIVKNKVNKIIKEKQLKTNPKIIIISKTFSIDKIKPLIENKHIHFGENKVQEAEDKWSETKNLYKELQLHMVGKLQSNKVKKALKIFDYIHSLDSKKLAIKISKGSQELNKKIKLFIQVNLGDEIQKSGIGLNEVDAFYNYCIQELSLNVIGLMCIPPANNSSKYFKSLKQAAERLSLKDLRMGMSSDFEDAVLNNSTYLRLGTVILGKRNII